MRRVALLVSLIALGSLGAASFAQRPASHPDATQAEIDGRVAVGLWASRGGELLDPGLHTARLVDEDHLEEELVYPSGHWFQPPAGRYRIWIEGSARVSPSFAFLQYAGGPFRGRGFAGVMDVVPAGEVILHPDLELAEDRSVRLLRVDATDRGEGQDRGFMRAITRDRADRPVLMPAGRAIGFLFDRKKGRYLAASLPFAVTPQERAWVLPEVRGSSTDLFVVLRRPEPVSRGEDDDVSFRLREGEEGSRPPDVLVPTWEWVYALWYDVAGRTVRLESISDRVFLEPAEIVLGAAGVATFRGELRLRPSLDVRVELPEQIDPEKLTLELFSVEESRDLLRREFPSGASSTRIEGLPAADLYASLTIHAHPGWTLSQRVDLRDGTSREIVFRPEPIFIRGTLYHRDEPTAGQIRIATDARRQPKSWLIADADDEGQYEAVLYAPGFYSIWARLPDAPTPDFPVHRSSIRHDDVIDVRIPGTAAVVRVEDSKTGEPVEDALVIYDNYFKSPAREREFNISMNTQTGENGVAPLAPPRPGRLVVWVEKEGYYRSSRVERTVIESQDELEIAVELDPVGNVSTLHLRLPNGSPAAGAEIRAQYLGWNEPPVWEGRADVEGRIDVASRAETGWLLIRHPEAGAWVEPWLPDGREALELRLPPAAEGAFTLLSVDGAGEAAPFRSVALRVGGTWIAGNSLAWLTRTYVAATDASGIWRAAGLPASEMAVIAGSYETIRLAMQGAIDGSAQRQSPPWSVEPVKVLSEGL